MRTNNTHFDTAAGLQPAETQLHDVGTGAAGAELRYLYRLDQQTRELTAALRSGSYKFEFGRFSCDAAGLPAYQDPLAVDCLTVVLSGKRETFSFNALDQRVRAHVAHSAGDAAARDALNAAWKENSQSLRTEVQQKFSREQKQRVLEWAAALSAVSCDPLSSSLAADKSLYDLNNPSLIRDYPETTLPLITLPESGAISLGMISKCVGYNQVLNRDFAEQAGEILRTWELKKVELCAAVQAQFSSSTGAEFLVEGLSRYIIGRIEADYREDPALLRSIALAEILEKMAPDSTAWERLEQSYRSREVPSYKRLREKVIAHLLPTVGRYQELESSELTLQAELAGVAADAVLLVRKLEAALFPNERELAVEVERRGGPELAQIFLSDSSTRESFRTSLALEAYFGIRLYAGNDLQEVQQRRSTLDFAVAHELAHRIAAAAGMSEDKFAAAHSRDLAQFTVQEHPLLHNSKIELQAALEQHLKESFLDGIALSLNRDLAVIDPAAEKTLELRVRAGVTACCQAHRVVLNESHHPIDHLALFMRAQAVLQCLTANYAGLLDQAALNLLQTTQESIAAAAAEKFKAFPLLSAGDAAGYIALCRKAFDCGSQEAGPPPTR